MLPTFNMVLTQFKLELLCPIRNICYAQREKYFALPSWANRLSIRGSGKVSALVTEFRTRVDVNSDRTVLLSG